VAEHYGFPVDHEALDPVPAGCLNDPRQALGPIVPTERNQSATIAIALDPQSVSVIFRFMKPLRACGHGFAEVAGRTQNAST